MEWTDSKEELVTDAELLSLARVAIVSAHAAEKAKKGIDVIIEASLQKCGQGDGNAQCIVELGSGVLDC